MIAAPAFGRPRMLRTSPARTLTTQCSSSGTIGSALVVFTRAKRIKAAGPSQEKNAAGIFPFSLVAWPRSRLLAGARNFERSRHSRDDSIEFSLHCARIGNIENASNPPVVGNHYFRVEDVPVSIAGQDEKLVFGALINNFARHARAQIFAFDFCRCPAGRVGRAQDP